MEIDRVDQLLLSSFHWLSPFRDASPVNLVVSVFPLQNLKQNFFLISEVAGHHSETTLNYK